MSEGLRKLGTAGCAGHGEVGDITKTSALGVDVSWMKLVLNCIGKE